MGSDRYLLESRFAIGELAGKREFAQEFKREATRKDQRELTAL